MSNVNVRVNLSQVDLDTLNTEDEIRQATRRLVPNTLKELGEASADVAWKAFQKTFRGSGFKPNNSASDKRKFVRDASNEYVRKASVTDKKKIEDCIVEQIHAQKSSHAEILDVMS
jgi:hypothetical protein